MVSSGINNVVFTSVYSEKTHLKKLIIMKIYYHEWMARNDGFKQVPEIDFRYETEARKVMVEYKFDTLYR